jgi:hypothetical protein
VTPSEPERTVGALLIKETSYETIQSFRSGDDDFPARLELRLPVSRLLTGPAGCAFRTEWAFNKIRLAKFAQGELQ